MPFRMGPWEISLIVMIVIGIPIVCIFTYAVYLVIKALRKYVKKG